MGVKERKAKEKLERREFVLETAMNLIRESGIQTLTMRKLADRIEYSACVVYEIFPNKQALIIDLFSKVCEELLQVMRAVPIKDDPEDYFRQLIRRDVEFMMQQSHRVELFTIVSMETSAKDFPASMKEVIQLIGQSLKGLNYRKLSTAKEIEEAQEVLRTFLAGLLKQIISNQAANSKAKSMRILENGLTVFLKGWSS